MFQYAVGANFDYLRGQAQIKEDRIHSQDKMTLNDGRVVKLLCGTHQTGQDSLEAYKTALGMKVPCGVYVGLDYLLMFELEDATDTNAFTSTVRFYSGPRPVDGRASDTSKVQLAAHERTGISYDLGKLVGTIPFCFNLKYDIEREFFKGAFCQRSLDRRAFERITCRRVLSGSRCKIGG